MNRSGAAAATVAALALIAGGCPGGGGGREVRGEALTVYVSAPLHGERGAEGKAIVDGARLALADAGGRVGGFDIRAAYLDDSRGRRWSMVRTAANARRAAEDVTAIGYIGDLDSGATRTSLPITNQAEMAQISPGSTAVDLTRVPPVGDLDPDRYRPSDKQTFARVVPDDEVQARAAAQFAKRLGARRAFVMSDGSPFGRTLADEFAREASGLGIGNAGRSDQAPPRASLDTIDLRGRPDVIYYGGSPGRTVSLVRAVSNSFPAAPVIASDALYDKSLRICRGLREPLYITSPLREPARLGRPAGAFLHGYRTRFGTPLPQAAYGYESMSLLLDSIRRAGDDGDDRDAVIDELLATRNRDSIVGRYSIDGNGDTTLDLITVYGVRDCRRSFDHELRAPR